eukprot:CAMPEP_0183387824 /NCGR_PEP_ID=MMETSP0370-20130417/3585_1 /TAXON_ID=268820 /ORGANISM="Peridinium aciculiferum, Strain PAER-2" /LENGTH=100 /DNA_ID=CAMNT_0025566555 /DNA_START=9 /DNA_END=311 /DNA_ORIENTATION=-
MSRRSTGSLLVIALCVAALWALAGPPFVAAPPSQQSTAALRGADAGAQAAALGAMIAATPDMAHAANQGYAVLQLGWAVFIIGLGPAVLFWIYFNKPEIL